MAPKPDQVEGQSSQILRQGCEVAKRSRGLSWCDTKLTSPKHPPQPNEKADPYLGGTAWNDTAETTERKQEKGSERPASQGEGGLFGIEADGSGALCPFPSE